jgi:hypothetical protein
LHKSERKWSKRGRRGSSWGGFYFLVPLLPDSPPSISSTKIRNPRPLISKNN